MPVTENGVHVLVRVCPSQSPESDGERSTPLVIDEETGTIALERKHKGVSEFKFSAILGPAASQADVYSKCHNIIGSDLLEGINCCIMAYGQTGSGKTYSMYGKGFGDLELTMSQTLFESSVELAPTLHIPSSKDGIVSEDESFGVAPRAVNDLFSLLEAKCGVESFDADSREQLDRKCSFSVQCQLMQIYNEKIYDLLQDKRRENPLQLRENRRGSATSVHVKGLSSYPVDSTDDVMSLLKRGLKNRAIRATEFNQESSRGHTVLQLHIEVEEEDADGLMVLKRSTLNLVDLAGSEKWKPPNTVNLSSSSNSYATQLAVEAQQKEMNNINTSLHVLGNCVSALIEPNRRHIPYRNSVLTRLLQDSLGNSSKGGRTIFIVTIHEDGAFREESHSTLQFANRASSIKMTIAPSAEVLGNISLDEAKRQIAFLRSKLKTVTDNPSNEDSNSCSITGKRPITSSSQATDRRQSCLQCTDLRIQLAEMQKQIDELIAQNAHLSLLLDQKDTSLVSTTVATGTSIEAANSPPPKQAASNISDSANSLPVTASPAGGIEDSILDNYLHKRSTTIQSGTSSSLLSSSIAPLMEGNGSNSSRQNSYDISNNSHNNNSSFSKRNVKNQPHVAASNTDDLELLSIGNSPIVPDNRSESDPKVATASKIPIDVDNQQQTNDEECRSPAVSSLKSLKKKIMKDRLDVEEIASVASLSNNGNNKANDGTNNHSNYNSNIANNARINGVSFSKAVASQELLFQSNMPSSSSASGPSFPLAIDSYASKPTAASAAITIQTAPAPNDACAKHGLAQCILCAMFGYSSVVASNTPAMAIPPIASAVTPHHQLQPLSTRSNYNSVNSVLSPKLPSTTDIVTRSNDIYSYSHSSLNFNSVRSRKLAEEDVHDSSAVADEFPSPSSSISSFSSLTIGQSTTSRYRPSASVATLKSPSSASDTKKMLSNLDNAECAAHGLSRCLLCALNGPSSMSAMPSSTSVRRNNKPTLEPLHDSTASATSRAAVASSAGSLSESIVGFPAFDTHPVPTNYDDKMKIGNQSLLERADMYSQSQPSLAVKAAATSVTFSTDSEPLIKPAREGLVLPPSGNFNFQPSLSLNMLPSNEDADDMTNLATKSEALEIPHAFSAAQGRGGYDREEPIQQEATRATRRPIAEFDPAQQIALLFGKSSSKYGEESNDVEYKYSDSANTNSRYRNEYANQAYPSEEFSELRGHNHEGDDDEEEDDEDEIHINNDNNEQQHNEDTIAEQRTQPRVKKAKKKKAKQVGQYAQLTANRRNEVAAKARRNETNQQRATATNHHAINTNASKFTTAAGYNAAEKAYGGGGGTAATASSHARSGSAKRR